MKKESSIHSFRTEVFRIILLCIAAMVLVLAVSMFFEFRFFTDLRQMVYDHTVFSNYYEDLHALEEELGIYINARSEESRKECVDSRNRMASESLRMTAIFSHPQFDDNSILNNRYLEQVDDILFPSLEDTDADILSHYIRADQISQYLIENETALSRIRTSIINEEYNRQFSKWVRQFIVMGVFLILCSAYILIIGNARVRRVVRPITDLTERMRHFQGDKVPEVSSMQTVRSEDSPVQKDYGIFVTETQVLEDAFARMTGTIREQMEQLKDKIRIDKELHDLQIQNLQMNVALSETRMQLIQSLISPHFLYNCLSTVSSLAYFENAPKTRRSAVYIARYLRDSVSLVGKDIPLKEEILHTEEYIHIQKLRFQDRIQFAVMFDGENKEAKVPAMILQPLVENSISHGLKSMVKDGQIDISVWTVSDRIYMEVRDNGTGMKKEIICQLRKELLSEQVSDKMTGIFGVWARLRMIYRDQARLEIESIPSSGTTVLLCIPASGLNT